MVDFAYWIFVFFFKETYNEAMLGRPNAEYCEWIRKPASWGGAIEVSILTNYYGIEIDVVDITNALINRFGEDKEYGMRVFLLFDGIHYDPLYLESITVSSCLLNICIFSMQLFWTFFFPFFFITPGWSTKNNVPRWRRIHLRSGRTISKRSTVIKTIHGCW